MILGVPSPSNPLPCASDPMHLRAPWDRRVEEGGHEWEVTRLGYSFAESANVLALDEPSELQCQECSVVTNAQQPSGFQGSIQGQILICWFVQTAVWSSMNCPPLQSKSSLLLSCPPMINDFLFRFMLPVETKSDWGTRSVCG